MNNMDGKEKILTMINTVIIEMERLYDVESLQIGMIGLVYKRYKKAKDFLSKGGDPLDDASQFTIMGGVRAYIDDYDVDLNDSKEIIEYMTKTERAVKEYMRKKKGIAAFRRITKKEIEIEDLKQEEISRKENYGYLGLWTVVRDIPNAEKSAEGYYEEIFFDVNRKSLYGVVVKEKLKLKIDWPNVILGLYQHPSDINTIMDDIKRIEKIYKNSLDDN